LRNAGNGRDAEASAGRSYGRSPKAAVKSPSRRQPSPAPGRPTMFPVGPFGSTDPCMGFFQSSAFLRPCPVRCGCSRLVVCALSCWSFFPGPPSPPRVLARGRRPLRGSKATNPFAFLQNAVAALFIDPPPDMGLPPSPLWANTAVRRRGTYRPSPVILHSCVSSSI